MDHIDIYKSVRSAKPNQAPGQLLPFVGVSLGPEESLSRLMNMDGKTFLKTVGQELLAANYDVKGHAGQKRSSSKKAQTNKSASATKKSAGTKTAAKKTSKPRKNSAKKPSKPKKKSAGTRKTSTSKARKNSTAKNKPKPKKPSKGKAGTDVQQQMQS